MATTPRSNELDFLVKQQTLEQELNGLISRFGKASVREHAKRLTVSKPGRRLEGDDIDLYPLHVEDAESLLAGKNPFESVSNKSIAKKIASDRPGQSAESTERRIMRKLSASRKQNALMYAALSSNDTHAYSIHLTTIKAAREVVDEGRKKTFDMLQANCEKEIGRYKELNSSDPPLDWSLKQIEASNHKFGKLSSLLDTPQSNQFKRFTLGSNI